MSGLRFTFAFLIGWSQSTTYEAYFEEYYDPI